MAEGPLRVGAVAVLQAGPHHVPRGGDRPGGRDPAQGRGAAGTRAALPRVALHHPSREGRGVAQGDDPAGQGPLRRHAGQARSPGLPPARGHPVHAAPGPQRRGRVEDAGHVQHSPSLPLLAARPGHPEGNPLRHRHAGLRPGGLRPLGRDAPERQHRRPRKVGQRQELRNEAGSPARHHSRRHRLRHRPRRRVRGHGEGGRRARPLSRHSRPGHEPLRHRQGGLRGASPAHRQPETAHRGDGGRAARARSAGPPSTTPWRATTPSPASAPASGTSTPTCKETKREANDLWHGCSGPSPPAA